MRRYFVIIFGLLALIAVECKHDPVDDHYQWVPQADSCATDSVYFNRDVQALLNKYCIGCHGPVDPRDGVDLSNYESIIRTAEVRAFDYESSDLYEVLVEEDVSKRMPQGEGANKLSAGEIEIIRTWIMDGALESECDYEEEVGCPDSLKCYTRDIAPIMDSTGCTSCHSGGTRDLSTYEGVKEVAISDALLGVIKHDPGFLPMPQNGEKLSQAEIDVIEAWINEGMND